METINIVLASDDKYAQFLGVTLCSLGENKAVGQRIHVYILDGGISKINKDKLLQLSDKYDFGIEFLKVDLNFYNKFSTSAHISQATYYRISIPNLIPDGIEKIIYLDSDLIVLSDLLELYSIDICNYFIAAVDEDVGERKKLLDIPNEFKYFNAGVMVLNLKKWRESNVSERVFKFIIDNPEKIVLWDQDAMNAVLFDKWLSIDKKFNFLTSMLAGNYKKDDVSIIHFSSSVKPWNVFCDHPFRSEYFKYLAKTPWKNKKIVDNPKNILINFFVRYFPNPLTRFIFSARKKLKG